MTIDELFIGLECVQIEQNSTEWLELRKTRLTSTDVTTIVLEFFFDHRNSKCAKEDLFVQKVCGKKIDAYLAEKFNRGKRSEAAVLERMKQSQILQDICISPVYANKYVSVSPDATAIRVHDNGKVEQIIYELKWTDHPKTVFYSFKDMDMSNYYVKKYCVQLAFHIIAFSKLKKLDRYCNGKILFSFEDPFAHYNKKIIHEAIHIDAYDGNGQPNVWIRAIINCADELVRAASCFSKGVDPYAPEPLLSSEVQEQIKKYMNARRNLDIAKFDKEEATRELLALMSQKNVDRFEFINEVGLDVCLCQTKRTEKQYILNNERVKQNEQVYNTLVNDIEFSANHLKKLQESVRGAFYDLEEKYTYSLRVNEKEVKGDVS
ncbi:MAG: hypothetical protein ACRCX2_04910 [Paraclostridium sp.]